MFIDVLIVCSHSTTRVQIECFREMSGTVVPNTRVRNSCREESSPFRALVLAHATAAHPCHGLRTAHDRRSRCEQLHSRGAADARAGDSREDRFEKAALLVEHEQWRNCSIPAYAKPASATTRGSFAHDFWRTLLRRVLGRPWLIAQHIYYMGDKQRTFLGRRRYDDLDYG